MTTAFDVPADALIGHLAGELQKAGKLEVPDWAAFARTGVHTERAPESTDWWFTRAASVLRKVYMHGPVGTHRLAQAYGGVRDRGSKPDKAATGSRSVARKILQGLEAAGLVQNIKGQGRVVTPKGRSLCDNAAHDVVKQLKKTVPALAKY